MNYKKLIKDYLTYKSVTWSPATLKSETARLNRLLEPLQRLNGLKFPDKLLEEVGENYRAYTLKIVLMRLGDLEAWAIMEGRLEPPGLVSELLRRSYRRFQGCYRKERLNTTFEIASRLIDAISDVEVRAHAKAILYTGMRYKESVTVDLEEKTVIGKGGMKRPVFNLEQCQPVLGLNYQKLRRGLATVGLKPHTLRKLAATHFAKVLDPVDLLRTMGWTNMNTAQLYIQEANDDVVAAKLKEAVK
jgi:integrase